MGIVLTSLTVLHLLHTLEKYSQTGFMFDPKNEELEEKIDEGFGEEVLENSVEVDLHAENLATVAPPSDSESDEVRISLFA